MGRFLAKVKRAVPSLWSLVIFYILHSDNTWIWSSYYTFLSSCCHATEKFRANLCFDSSKHSLQTADGNNKVTSRVLQTILVAYIFKLVLHFDWAVINNQIKYHFKQNERIFGENQCGIERGNWNSECQRLLLEYLDTKSYHLQSL